MLQSTCSAVPGDFITYIVTCDFRGMCSTPSTATGSVTFRYNERVFNFIGMSPAPIYNSTGLVVDALDNPNNTTDPILKKVVYTFSNIPTDRQFNLFFQLQTKNDASLLGLNPMPSAELQVSSTGGCDKFEVNDLITGQTVRSSHDPNYVEIVSNDPCDLSGDIKWRIHFQNEGNAPEDSIWITDWIDPMLDFSNATTPVWSGINGSTLATWKRQGDRTVNWFIDGLRLKGLGQRGVREDETRGYVELITKKSQHFDCSAFVNRARIRFGSKPPIETADAIVSMPCTRDELCSDSCLTILDTAFARRATLLGDLLLNGPMFTTNAVAMLDNASHLKWYPADGLYSAITLNPSLTKNVRRVYTLVASFPGCKRSIIRVPVGPDCNIRFTQKTLLSNGDCNKPNWNLTVNAIGVPATNLMWHNGTTGVSSFLTANHTPQLVYVGVWDTLTGCSAEKWIKLADKCPSSNPRGPWVPIGVVAFMVVIAFFLLKIFSKK